MQILINLSGLIGVFIPPNTFVSNQNWVFTSKSWSPDTHFKLDCSYHLHASCKNVNPYLD